MNNRNKKIIIAILIVLIYLGVKYLYPPLYILFYPVALLVTYMHELGHIIAALISGGGVKALQINPNGSGFAVVYGGNIYLILMGGYIGSAILGNLLFYIAIKKEKLTVAVSIISAIIMILTSFFLFSSIFTSMILIIFAATIIFIIKKMRKILNYLLLCLGILSVTYIIEDYKVGPSSDIQKFAEIAPFGVFFWMIVWLIIVIIISYFNFRLIIKK